MSDSVENGMTDEDAIDSHAVGQWITAYRAAWESNDPADIGALFTDDAVYYNEPFTEPSRGRDAIVAKWLERKDDPGTTTFTWKLLAQTDGLAFVQGETDYGAAKYSNLWVIRLSPFQSSLSPFPSSLAPSDSSAPRAIEFTEWWMDQSQPS